MDMASQPSLAVTRRSPYRETGLAARRIVSSGCLIQLVIQRCCTAWAIIAMPKSAKAEKLAEIGEPGDEVAWRMLPEAENADVLLR